MLGEQYPWAFSLNSSAYYCAFVPFFQYVAPFSVFMFRYIENKPLYIKPEMERWQSGPREGSLHS